MMMEEEPASRVPASRGPLLYRGAHTLPVARRADERSGAPRSEVALLTFFGLESGIDAEPCGVSVDAVHTSKRHAHEPRVVIGRPFPSARWSPGSRCTPAP